MKICKQCGEEKVLSEYYSQEKSLANGTQKTYYKPMCKDCAKKNAKEWKMNNYEKVLESQRKHNYKPARLQKRKELNKQLREEGYYLDWQRENKDKIKNYSHNRQHKDHNISNEEWKTCKSYFNYECAYCGLHIDEHFNKYKGELIWTDFHKDHVDHEGKNDLSNCIPSCKSCNSSKHTFALEDWYRKSSAYSEERLAKIYSWLDREYMMHIITQ